MRDGGKGARGNPRFISTTLPDTRTVFARGFFEGYRVIRSSASFSELNHSFHGAAENFRTNQNKQNNKILAHSYISIV